MASETIPKVIDQQKWLDPLSEQIQTAVHKWFEAGGDSGQLIKDLLHGTWLGHPLHPVLTDIPIGAWTAALVLDALEGISGRRELRAGADAAVGLGLLGAAFIASGEMAVAYFMVHFPNGPLPLLNKGELAALYCFVFLYIAAHGSGIWSVDALMPGRKRSFVT